MQDADDDVTGPGGVPFDAGDFAELRDSGGHTGTSWVIGYPFVRARDRLAGFLGGLGISPNAITMTGLVLTTCAGACFAVGGSHTFGEVPGLPSSWWCFVAFGLLFGAGACDMLDGAVARVANLSTKLGQVLDSTLDRFSDCVLFLGLIVHFAWQGNVTLCGLAGLGMIHAYSISYVKARSESLVAFGNAGWWQRPERYFGFLVGALFGHMPALIWQQATMPFLTVLFRLRHAKASVEADDRGEPPPSSGPLPGVLRYLAPWRHGRGGLAYDVTAAVNIGWIIVAPWIWPFFYGRSDPLGQLMDRWFA